MTHELVFSAGRPKTEPTEPLVAVRRLAPLALINLAGGPTTGCCVCEVLRGRQDEASRWLVQWHGSDPVRCGIIYGLAAAVLWARSCAPQEVAALSATDTEAP